MSRPFLCDCGDVIDVNGLTEDQPIHCPLCSWSGSIEEHPDRLLALSAHGGGVYDSLLRDRLSTAEGLPIAGQLATVPPSRIEETTPIPTRGASSTRVAREPVAPPARNSALQPGERLGPFRIDAVLGRGGMGVVYDAFDTELERKVALKVLGADLLREEEHVDRFRREARSAAALSHPNITHIYGMGSEGGIHWFAMEIVRGKTLAEKVDEDGPIDFMTAQQYLEQIVAGLQAAHSHEIIHRDLKPSNLILDEEGRVKISDFGLAKIATDSVEITATGIVMGTPLYMSPEQGRGESVDHRSDIYSLGCTFHHLLSGQPPFTGETAMAVILKHITDEPPPLDEATVGPLGSILTRMLRKSPEERHQSYEELLSDLRSSRREPGFGAEPVHGGRTILVTEVPDPARSLDPMNSKQLSVADANLGLGRDEKALSLYRKVGEDCPELAVEIAFRELKIHQRQGNEAQVEALLRQLLQTTVEPADRAYCRWKLTCITLERSHLAVRESREWVEELLREEIPSAIPVGPLKMRLVQLNELEQHLGDDLSGGMLLVRKSGDFQLELD